MADLDTTTEDLIDYASSNLAAAKIKLRQDLRFSIQLRDNQSWYLIEDKLYSKFYRIGQAEYTFSSKLDGKTTLESAIAATAAELGIDAFTEADAASYCKWLIDSNLAEKDRIDLKRWNSIQTKARFIKGIQWLNPIMLKMPIGNPDRMVGYLTNCFGWILSYPIASIYMLIAIASTCFLSTKTETLFSPPESLLTRDNWIWLAVIWLVLRVIHESAHAISCKKFGGSVNEWGILWLMFFPLPYVNVTSSWRFPDRKHRIFTSAAGMIAEVGIAAIASLVWYFSIDPFIKQQALNVMLAASVTTVVFNVNPLMRFDGYYILSDWLDAPNLWKHGRQFVTSLSRRFFFGRSSTQPAVRKELLVFSRLYGVAALVWSTFVFLTISVAALNLLHGIGLILAMLFASLWIGVPAFKVVRFAIFGTPTESPNRFRFSLAVLLTSSMLFSLGTYIPAPQVIQAPCVIEHAPISTVRNETPGMIERIEVESGESVSAGDLLCVLQNHELCAKLHQLRLDRMEAQHRIRRFQASDEPAATQYEQEAFNDLSTKLKQLETQVAGLQIYAPIDGIVLTSRLTQQLGTYAQIGTPILSIGATDSKKVIALVRQSEGESISKLAKNTAKLKVWGDFGTRHVASVTKIQPRATISLPHFSFAAPAGGPLAVVQAKASPDASVPESSYRLVRPHVEVELALPSELSSKIRSGQTGLVFFRARNATLGQFVYDRTRQFFKQNLRTTHGL